MLDHENGAQGRAELDNQRPSERDWAVQSIAAIVTQAVQDALCDHKPACRQGRKPGPLSANAKTVERRVGHAREAAEAKRDALVWLMSDNREPFSFVWCCENLGIEPDQVRARMAAEPGRVVAGIVCTSKGRASKA